MTTLMKRMAVMSAALILLCVNVLAQNEEKNKNVTNEVYPASLAAHIKRLIPGEEWICQVTLMQGYDLPYIVYTGSNYYPEMQVEGILFSAKISDNGNRKYTFEIRAKDYNKSKTYEDLKIKATHEAMLFNLNRETTQNSGFPFRIEVYK